MRTLELLKELALQEVRRPGLYDDQGKLGSHLPVGRSLGSVDELVCQALRNGLDVPERSLPGACGDQIDGLVDAPQWGDIHCLPSDDTSRSDSCGILAGTTAPHSRSNLMHTQPCKPENTQPCSS